MDNNKDVPYIVYESEAARHERTVKRLIHSEERYVRPDGSYSRRGRSRDSMGRYSGEGSIDEKTKEELYKMIEKM